jgi:probable dihydroxyacetone kinase regulator
VFGLPESYITKKALANAMKVLMEQRPFSKISVGDICALCKMNRKSFYYHFKDKYDLVNWIYYTEFVTTVQTQAHGFEDGMKLMSALCGYFYQNRHFYMNALEVTGQNSFRDYFRDMLKPVVQGNLSGILSSHENAEFFAVFYTDAFLFAIIRWLTETPCRPPDEFVKLLNTSIAGVAKKIAEEIDHLEQQEP